MKNNKKGVSLVTVLLFMLVATLAATATFKWLGTENLTSAGRLRVAEARQASKAGLEALRAHMTYNANDVGAWIHQYNANGKKPIRLDSALGAQPQGKAQYTVWLTGVDASNASYKLKITSVGTSTQGTKFSENSILKVDGLYRVKIPQESSTIHFNQAFSGKIGKVTSSNIIQSALVNGSIEKNIHGESNTPLVTENMVVNGNVEYGGGTNQGSDLYIKGNFTNKGSLTVGAVDGSGKCLKDTNVVFVGGSITSCANLFTVCGDLYVGGNVSDDCKLYVSGNMTINGALKRSGQAQRWQVNKNMVFTENASLDLLGDQFGSNPGDNLIGMNAYFPKAIEGHCGSDCGDQNGNRRMAVTGDVYYYKDGVVNKTNTNPWGGMWGGMWGSMGGTANSQRYYELLAQPAVATTYTYGAFMKGTTVADVQNDNTRKKKRMMSFSAKALRITDEDDLIESWNPEDRVLKHIGGNYWAGIRKMAAYGNLIDETENIPQPLLLKDEEGWMGKIANKKGPGQKDVCKDAGYDIKKDPGAEAALARQVDKINDCYNKLKAENPDALYNGFMVLDMKVGDKADTDKKLNGKYILVYNDLGDQNLSLPATTKDAVVMLYFKKGVKGLQKAKSGAVADDDYYHYFVYSEGNINTILDKLEIQGSMIMANGSTMEDLNSGTLSYESYVLETLAGAGIIEENPEFTKRVAPEEASEGSSSSTPAARADDYYIGSGPQLSITLESQYKNNELDVENLRPQDYAEVEPSIMVLPRIIYLTQDPPGQLKDYYNVINLNGATERSSDGYVTCDGSGLPTSGLLYSNNVLIPAKPSIYNCSYSSSKYGSMPFWVVIAGKNGETPAVNFEKDGDNLTLGGPSVAVNLTVPATTNTNKMYVDVVLSSVPDGWQITPVSGVTSLHGVTSTDGDLVYTVAFDGKSGLVHAFDIQVPADASSGEVVFSLIPPTSGCTIGNQHSTYKAEVTGFADIKRENIPATYCTEGHETLVGSDGKTYNCSDVADANWPSCNSSQQSGEWVYPYCNRLTTTDPNNAWRCGTNLAIKLQKKNIAVPCIAFIADTSLEAKNEESYTLFASLKRKSYTLKVKASENNGNVMLKVSRVEGSSTVPMESYATDVDGYALYKVYYDQVLNVETDDFVGDKFANWRCTGTSCGDRTIYAKKIYDNLTIRGDVTLIAHFNERDKHCFYDAFASADNSADVKEEFLVFCDGKNNWGRSTNSNYNYENCVDKCKSGTNCKVGSGSYPKSNWTMVYANHASNALTGCESYKGILCARHTPNEFEEPLVSAATFRAPAGIFTANLSNRFSPTVLINRVQGGSNGTMTVRMRIPTEATEILETALGAHDNYNDALIFRSDSNASSYLSLNVFRGEVLKGKVGGRARVCYVQGQMASEKSDCIESNLMNKLNGNYVPVAALGDVTVRATIDSSTLVVNLNYWDDGSRASGTVTFDLNQLKNKTLATRSAGHDLVGLKMFNTFYHYRDLSWSSEDYRDDCFAAPRVYCSFKNNYMGGTVPLNEEVHPWVGWSSWFDEKGCTDVKYYYNGCDVGSTYFKNGGPNFRNELGFPQSCSNKESYGGFWYEGAEMHDNTYKFEVPGDHRVAMTQELIGKYSRGGYLMNASVQMNCDGANVWSDCGAFYVGEITSCSENAHIYGGTSVKTCSGNLECSAMLDGESVKNLRDSKLSVTISDMTEGDAIKVSLVDKHGIRSTAYTITAPGTYSFEVNDYSHVDGFDPQSVRGVELFGSYTYDVSVVESACPNVPGIGNACSAVISSTGSGFNVNAPGIAHTELAQSCVVKNDQKLLSDVNYSECSADGAFFVPMGDLMKTVNSNGSTSTDVSFTIEMLDNNGNTTSCKTNTVTLKKSAVSCMEDKQIIAGQGLPDFKYSMIDCPTGGCSGTVELYGKSDKSTVTCTDNSGSCLNQTWSYSGGTIATKAGDEFIYRLTYSSLSCESKVTVKPAVPATAENCRIEGNVFKAKINAQNYGDYTAQLWYYDGMGIEIGANRPITTNIDPYEQSLSQISVANTYKVYLTINGEKACEVDYTVGGTSGGETPTSSAEVVESSAEAVLDPKAECWFETNVNGTVTKITKVIEGRPYTDFKIKTTSGVKDASTATFTMGSYTTPIGLPSNGNTTSLQMTIPMGTGSKSYSVTYNGKTVCEGSINVEKALTCSVNPASVEKGKEYTFTVDKVSSVNNCWSCTYDYEDLSESSYFGSIKKIASKEGNHTLNFSCTCDNASASCSAPLTVTKPAGGTGGGTGGTTGSEISMTLDYSLENSLQTIQGSVYIVCHDRDQYNKVATVRCCPASDCYNGSLSSPLKMSGKDMGTSPRLHEAYVSCKEGDRVLIESADAVKCGVANN